MTSPIEAIDAFNAYYQRKRRAFRTIQKYDMLFDRFIQAGGITDLATVDETDVEAFLDHYQHLSDHTIATHLTMLKSMFNWFARKEYIPYNPFIDFELPAYTAQLREPLSLVDLERLLDYVPHDARQSCYAYSGYRDNLLWHCCALAGMRIREVTGLLVKDVSGPVIYIRNAKGHQSRTVPIVPRLRAAIERYQPYLTFQLKHVPTLDDYLFPGRGGPLTTPTIWDRFHRAQQTLGFERVYGFHHLRHTYATMLLEQDVNLPTLQKLLGHRQLTTTQIYLHVSDRDATAAAMRHPLAAAPDQGIQVAR